MAKHSYYVPQTVYLLNESIKRNIAFELDDEKIDDNKVNDVIKKVQLSNLVSRMRWDKYKHW